MSNEQTPATMEDRLNALLDGELTADQREELQQAATTDAELASALRETLALKAAFREISTDPIPASLAQKLAGIAERSASERPAKRRLAERRPVWLAAAAAVVLVAGLVVSMQRAEQAREVQQAREELDLAFAYLGKVSGKAHRQINSTVSRGISDPLAAISFRVWDPNSELTEE